MSCTRRDHYPSDESYATLDPHHHRAGRVEVVDGRTVVVNATPCEPPGYGQPGYARDFERWLEDHPWGASSRASHTRASG